MAYLVENQSVPLLQQPKPERITDKTELAKIESFPYLISHRLEDDPFKEPFLDTVKTDPFSGSIFLREEGDWFKAQDLESAIHFCVNQLRAKGKDDIVAETFLLHERLKQVFPLFGRNNLALAKKKTLEALLASGFGPKTINFLKRSLAASVDDEQSTITNLFRWLNSLYKHILAKEPTRFSSVLLALLLERSLERFSFEQILQFFDEVGENVTNIKQKKLENLKGLLNPAAIRVSPYRQAADSIRQVMFKEEGEEKNFTDSNQDTLYQMVNDNIIQSWYPEKIKGIIEFIKQKAQEALDLGVLALPVVQTSFL